jgi:2-oxoisovalerate dehydrogenase E1 component alpha subunit
MSLAKDMNLPKGLNKQKVLQIYEQMLMVRLIDERVWAMNRQGKVPIAASCQGHEAAQLGSLAASQYLGDCFFFTYYRDLALKFGTGLNEKDIMLSYLGRNGDPYSNGRQFPLQGADLSRNVIQLSNVVAAGMPQAVGYALASKIKREPTVSLSFFGDGASSQGECHEAMNFAGIHKLPIVFVCENNHYAISVPQNLQMTVSEVSERAPGYGLSAISIDGSDFFQVYESMLEAIALARRNVPVLVEMNVERIMPHTSDDDHSRYRDQSEITNMRDRDPLTKLEQWITSHKLTTESEIATITASCKQRVNLATEYAESAPEPEASSLYDNLFSK